MININETNKILFNILFLQKKFNILANLKSFFHLLVMYQKEFVILC